ncbi:MAG: hypothetical protein A2Z14_10830 [Chloroflexi bacterium RBG_16_48_8]|nr:MAG: hypothetical protein A2Z14_10830 [Chloroflexi bacterium RBG_16_48_8]
MPFMGILLLREILETRWMLSSKRNPCSQFLAVKVISTTLLFVSLILLTKIFSIQMEEAFVVSLIGSFRNQQWYFSIPSFLEHILSFCEDRLVMMFTKGTTPGLFIFSWAWKGYPPRRSHLIALMKFSSRTTIIYGQELVTRKGLER